MCLVRTFNPSLKIDQPDINKTGTTTNKETADATKISKNNDTDDAKKEDNEDNDAKETAGEK